MNFYRVELPFYLFEALKLFYMTHGSKFNVKNLQHFHFNNKFMGGVFFSMEGN